MTRAAIMQALWEALHGGKIRSLIAIMVAEI
jgi:hypothetical protein